MSPVPADRLGPYEIICELGRGGGGVVYLARDTRLDRNVAINALPPHAAQDADPRSGRSRSPQRFDVASREWGRPEHAAWHVIDDDAG